MIEKRGDRTYHYRSERTPDGRVRRVYEGPGLLAEVEAELARLDREEREAERLAEEARLEDLVAEIGESAESIGEAARLAERVVAARMARLNVRRVGSRWRRERGKTMTQIAAVKPNTLDTRAAERRVSASMLGRLGMAMRWLPQGPGSGEVKEAMTKEAIGRARDLAGERPSPAEWELALLASLIGLELIRWEAEVDNLSGLGSPKRFDTASRHLNRLRRQQAATLRDLAAIRRYQTATLVQIGQLNVATGHQQINNQAPAVEPPPPVIEARSAKLRAKGRGGPSGAGTNG